MRALHCVGFRLHRLMHCVCGCFSNLFTSDLNSLASWAGRLEAACSTTVMYASMGVLGVDGIIGSFL